MLLNFVRGVGEPIAHFYHHTVTRYFCLQLNSEAHHHFMYCKDFLSVSFINPLVIIIQVIASSITIRQGWQGHGSVTNVCSRSQL